MIAYELPMLWMSTLYQKQKYVCWTLWVIERMWDFSREKFLLNSLFTLGTVFRNKNSQELFTFDPAQSRIFSSQLRKMNLESLDHLVLHCQQYHTVLRNVSKTCLVIFFYAQ